MAEFARDYLILVFFSSLGALQIAASYGRLKGLLLLQIPTASRLLGAFLVLTVVIWFFASAPRNINDTDGGLDGNFQALLFALGALAAVAVTLVGSSIINARMRIHTFSTPAGLEALTESNYLYALINSLSYWWKKWRMQMHRYFFG